MFNYDLRLFQLTVNKMKLYIESAHSFLYDSLSQLIEAVAQEAILAAQDEIGDNIIGTINRGRDDFKDTIFSTNDSLQIFQDIRLFELADIQRDYYSMDYPGYYCVRNAEAKTCTGVYFNESEILTPPAAQSNWDYQVYYHRSAVNSFLQAVFK